MTTTPQQVLTPEQQRLERLQQVYQDGEALMQTQSERALTSFETVMREIPLADSNNNNGEETEEKMEHVTSSSNESHNTTTTTTTVVVESVVTAETKSSLAHLRESALYKIIETLTLMKDAARLVAFLRETRKDFANFQKAKTAKIVRMVVDGLGKIPGSEHLQIATCREYVEWAIQEKRVFLRHRIQCRLASLLAARGDNQEALQILKEMTSEVKKLDDKPLLVEIYLIESRIHLGLRNTPKAKASLTAARSTANSIYVAPPLQCEIDMLGGLLNATDRDFRTAYSYFYEAFEGLHLAGDDASAGKALKFMLVCKIMMGLGDDIPAILSAKNALKYQNSDIEAMREVARAYKERSLHAYDRVLAKYPRELSGDPIIAKHLTELSSNLLEKNLVKIIEAYSRVDVARVAELIELPVERVEAKLSQMILDNKLKGILDQGLGELVVFDDPEPDESYDAALSVIEKMGEVTDSLSRRTSKLHA